MRTIDLFGHSHDLSLPTGLRYEPRLKNSEEALSLVQTISGLPFAAFEFHGFTGKRRVVSFGWKYDFSSQRLEKFEPTPDFLLPLRLQAARLGGLDAAELEQVLVTEYRPGAAIGRHKDKAVFDEVIGVSFGATCTMRFRRAEGGSWERLSVQLEPGSAYIITGQSRSDWEHSIPPVDALR